MKNLSLIVAIIASSLITIPAFAAATTVPTTPKDRVYISGDVGYGKLATPDEDFIEPDGTVIIGASHKIGSIAAGGNIGFQHAATPHALIGAEFGFNYNGNSKYTEDYPPNFFMTASTIGKVNSKDFHLLATGTYLFNSGFNIFAKAGGARVDQTLKVSNQIYYFPTPLLLGESSVVQYKPMVAAGIGYQFKMFDLFGQYTHIFGTNATDFSDLLDTNTGTLSQVVSVDTFKAGVSVAINV